MYTELFLLTLLSIARGQLEDQKDAACLFIEVRCSCGTDKNRQDVFLTLEAHRIQDPETGEMKCGEIPDPHQACVNHTCSFVSIAGIIDPTRKRRDSGLQLNHFAEFFFPQVFTVPRGGFPKGHRFARQVYPCSVPSLENAEIKCWKWPNWMNCDINCLPGYAVGSDVGAVKSINVNCRNTENVWKPHGFIDCKPYLNCNAHLVKPGDLTCMQPLDAPAYCQISCLDYDMFEATAMKKYDCIDENFAEILPHCAVLSDNVDLIEKP